MLLMSLRASNIPKIFIPFLDDSLINKSITESSYFYIQQDFFLLKAFGLSLTLDLITPNLSKDSFRIEDNSHMLLHPTLPTKKSNIIKLEGKLSYRQTHSAWQSMIVDHHVRRVRL